MNLYEAEAELARCGLGYPKGIAQAYDAGTLRDSVESDVLAAVIAACVQWREAGGERMGDRWEAARTLRDLTAKSLLIADAWADRPVTPGDDPAWLSPVWGIVEVAEAVSWFPRSLLGAEVVEARWHRALNVWRQAVVAEASWRN